MKSHRMQFQFLCSGSKINFNQQITRSVFDNQHLACSCDSQQILAKFFKKICLWLVEGVKKQIKTNRFIFIYLFLQRRFHGNGEYTQQRRFLFFFLFYLFYLYVSIGHFKCETKLNEKFSLPRKLYLNDVEDWLIVFRCNDRINSHNYILFNFF